MTEAKKKTGKWKYDVICVGSAAIDCFVTIPIDFKDIKHGSKVLIEDMKLFTGGGGSNVAVGLARLGIHSGFIGEVGDDVSAEMIRNELKKEDVDFLVKHHSRHKTAYSVVLESKAKGGATDRAILVYKGASSDLYPSEIHKNLIRCGWFYFASVMGASMSTMDMLARFAKKKGIKVYFNPSGYMVEHGGKAFTDILSATTVLALNKEEAQLLLDMHTSDTVTLLKNMRKLGPEICMITDGKNGIHAFDGSEFYFKKAHPVKVIDTTGAGDAFGTGFLAGLVIKSSAGSSERINFALDLGLADAEAVIGAVGAKTGLLTRKAAFSKMR
jgi:sugar/nucleoside kinase (ribokinase family)